MAAKETPAVICVTGKMAAGKNTVSKRFQRRGWHVIDADVLAHRAVGKMTPRIIEEFKDIAHKKGIEIEKNGVIDRRALGRLLFRSPELLKRQEAMVLPEVERCALEEMEAAKGAGVVLNAVSLYKTPRLMSLCSLVVFVTAPAFVRLKRVRRRDKLPLLDILGRFASQRGLLKEYKKTGAGVVVVKNC